MCVLIYRYNSIRIESFIYMVEMWKAQLLQLACAYTPMIGQRKPKTTRNKRHFNRHKNENEFKTRKNIEKPIKFCVLYRTYNVVECVANKTTMITKWQFNKCARNGIPRTDWAIESVNVWKKGNTNNEQFQTWNDDFIHSHIEIHWLGRCYPLSNL